MKKLALILFLLVSCNDSKSTDTGGGGPVDPYADCDKVELEPNDQHDEANFLDIFPVTSPEVVCGDLTNNDSDYYYIFLDPSYPPPVFFLSVLLRTDPEVVPVIKLSQSVYDPLGSPTGQHQTIGVFYGEQGILFFEDFPVTHMHLVKNDLFIEVGSASPLFNKHEYELEYWNF
mgnify:FL=1